MEAHVWMRALGVSYLLTPSKCYSHMSGQEKEIRETMKLRIGRLPHATAIAGVAIFMMSAKRIRSNGM